MQLLLYKLAIKNILSVTCLFWISTFLRAQTLDVKLNLKQVAFTNPQIKEQLSKNKFWNDYHGPIDECIGSDSTGIYFKRRPNEFYPRILITVIDQYDYNYNLTSQIVIGSERNDEIQQIVLLNGKLFAITRTYIKNGEYYQIKAHAIPKEGGVLPAGMLLEEAELERTDAPIYRRLYTDWSWNEKYVAIQNNTQLLMAYIKAPKPQKKATLVINVFDKELKSIKRRELELPANESANFAPSKLTPLTRVEIKQLQIDTLGQVWMLLQTVSTLNRKRAHNYWDRQYPFWKDNHVKEYKNNFILQYNLQNERHHIAQLDKPERIIDDCKLLLHPEKNLVYVGGSMRLQKSDIKTEYSMFLHTLSTSDMSLLNYTEQPLSAATDCAAGYMGKKKKPTYAYKKTFFRIELDRFYKVQYLQLSPDKQHVIMGQEHFVTNLGSEFVVDIDFTRLFYLDVYCSVFSYDGNPKRMFHIPKVQNCRLHSFDRSAMDIFASYVLQTQNNYLYVLYNEVYENIEEPRRLVKNNGRGRPFLYTISLADGSFTGKWLNIPELQPELDVSPYFTQMHPNSPWNIYLQEFHFFKNVRPFWGTLEVPK